MKRKKTIKRSRLFINNEKLHPDHRKKEISLSFKETKKGKTSKIKNPKKKRYRKPLWV